MWLWYGDPFLIVGVCLVTIDLLCCVVVTTLKLTLSHTSPSALHTHLTAPARPGGSQEVGRRRQPGLEVCVGLTGADSLSVMCCRGGEWPDWVEDRPEAGGVLAVLVLQSPLRWCSSAAVLTPQYYNTCHWLQPKSENISSRAPLKIFMNFLYHSLIPLKYSNMRHNILNIFQDIPSFKIYNIMLEKFSRSDYIIWSS